MRIVSAEPEAVKLSFDAMKGKESALAVLLPFAISAGHLQLWALAAAVAAAFLAYLAYLLRRALGLVQPPPPEEDKPH
ncbi:MAG: hypothetical protein ABSC13_00975 [Dehalococcoidia bacterium]